MTRKEVTPNSLSAFFKAHRRHDDLPAICSALDGAEAARRVFRESPEKREAAAVLLADDAIALAAFRDELARLE